MLFRRNGFMLRSCMFTFKCLDEPNLGEMRINRQRTNIFQPS